MEMTKEKPELHTIFGKRIHRTQLLTKSPTSSYLVSGDLQELMKSLLRYINRAHTFHSFLAFLLLLQQLPLPTNIAAIAFCKDIFPHC